MINENCFRRIVENTPEHFWKTWNKNHPLEIKLKWLSKFIKKDITKEIFIRFIEDNYYHFYNSQSIDDYKKTEHYLILKDVLNIDLEKYDWFYKNKLYNSLEFNRDFKIWQLGRN